jgi:hypothetical protein
MALVVNDRVQQTGTANTTVSFTLTGTVVGYQSFAVIGNGNTTFYAATDVSGSWEVGVGTYSTTEPTLVRTTILSSSNSGNAVTFSGTVTVFVTYPSEQSVNLDASGNVTALGTITSGVWNGTTIPVAYGGTGVTSSSGANSVVLRDANQNINFNNFIASSAITTAAAGTTVLTVASARNQILVGSTTQTFQLPNATTLQVGQSFLFVNNSSGTLTVVDNASTLLDIVPSGGIAQLGAGNIATSAGTWGIYSFLPGSYNFNTSSADFGTATISNATWNGGTIQPAYGGTGITTFSAANNALFSTGASTLTAGTLPVAAGGTGATTLTSNGVVYGNGTSAAGITAAGTTGQVLVATTSGAPSWGSVPAASITGTVPIVNGGTGQTTAAAAFNALSPLTTTGDIIYEASASTAARLPIGVSGQVLTATGGIPAWATPSTGAGTITRTDFTATASQTVFSVTYDVGLIDVYQNGAKLAQADFTATNGTSFTLATGATSGDLIQAEVFSSLNIYSTITAETFNGTGSQTVFTMSAVPANSASLLVAISGVVQDPTTYTVSSNTLTFSTAPPSGTGNVAVRYLGVQSVSTVSSFSAGTTGFTPATATTGGVVLAGTLATTNGGTGLTAVGTNGQVLTSNGTTLSYQTPTQTYPGAGIANSTGSAWGTSYTTTGTGTVVALATSPTFVTPTLGSATATQLTTGLGTVSAPALTFSGDTNTGIYSPTADTIAFVEGGAEAMRITSAGNVGIGLTNPTQKLEVTGNIKINSGVVAGERGTAAAPAFSFSDDLDTGMFNVSNLDLGFSTQGSERMRIDSSGNVGIGTSSPAYKLDISGSTGNVSVRIIPTTEAANIADIRTLSVRRIATDSVLGIGYATTPDAWYISPSFGGTGAYKPLAFATSDTERGRFDTSGNFLFNSGYGSVATAYGTRAWVNFNGTGTVAIRASGNVSSITDNGTGDYTMNFTTAMPDANYVLSGTCMYSSGTNAHYIGLGDVNGAGGTLPTTTAVRFRTIHSTGAAAQDCTWVEVSVIR